MTKPSYYSRENVTHLDGTQIFQTSQDRDSESVVASQIQQQWDCQLFRFGALAPIDWYSKRLDRLVGVLELKSRSHESTKYPPVFLNVRKWLALTLASTGLGVPAIFVVRFTDGIQWIPVNEVEASRVRIGGCSRRVKSDNDVEPVIEVAVNKLRPLISNKPEEEHHQ